MASKLGLRRFVPLLFGAGLLLFAGGKIGWDKVFEAISKAKLEFLAVVFAFALVVLALKSVREWLILKKISSTAFKGFRPMQIFAVGVFTNEFLPVGSGELMRAYIINRLAKVGFGRPLAPLLIQRSFDTFFLLLVALAGLAVLFSEQVSAALMSLVLVGVLVVFFFAAVFKRGFAASLAIFGAQVVLRVSSFASFARKTGRDLHGKILDVAGSFEESRHFFVKDKLLLAKIFLLTCFAWSVEAVVQQNLLASLGMQVDYVNVFAITALAVMIGAFSFIPGGLGAREGAYALFASLVGVPLEIGFATSILYRGIAYVIYGSISLYSFWDFKMSLAHVGDRVSGK